MNEILKKFELFSCFEHLSIEEKGYLGMHLQFASKNNGESVFEEGQFCENLYFLVKGSVKTFTIDPITNKEHINSLEHAVNIFGECCLFGMPEKVFSAVCIEDGTEYFSIDIKAFKSVMEANFKFNLSVFELIGRKMKKIQSRLIDFATKDARARVVEFLKGNAGSVGRQVGYETLVKHGLTQQDIATYTGTSRQTVTTILNDLKKTNQIYLRRKSILIRDVASLN